jgi:hypothetical protein
VRSTRTRREIEARLDDTEHRGAWATPTTAQGVEAALASGEAFTPVGVAAMVLWGATAFGREWSDVVVGPFVAR